MSTPALTCASTTSCVACSHWRLVRHDPSHENGSRHATAPFRFNASTTGAATLLAASHRVLCLSHVALPKFTNILHILSPSVLVKSAYSLMTIPGDKLGQQKTRTATLLTMSDSGLMDSTGTTAQTKYHDLGIQIARAIFDCPSDGKGMASLIELGDSAAQPDRAPKDDRMQPAPRVAILRRNILSRRRDARSRARFAQGGD